MQFWQPYQIFFTKKPQIFHSDSKKGREKLWIFWKENYFSSNCASAHVESICDHPVKNLSSQLWKLFARIQDEKFVRFPNKVVSPQIVRLTCTMKVWQAWRKFVAKKRKTFPNSKNVEVTMFRTNLFFFIKNDSLATENAILTTVANSFLWESTHL